MNKTEFDYTSFDGASIDWEEYHVTLEAADVLSEQVQALFGQNVLVEVLAVCSEREGTERTDRWLVSVWRFDASYFDIAEARENLKSAASFETYLFEDAEQAQKALLNFISKVMIFQNA